jgi:hypothetical protein
MEKPMSWLVVGLFLIASLWIGNILEVAPAEASSITLELLNPRAEFEPPPNLAIAPRVTDLAGKKIGLYWNGKPDGNLFFDRVQELLKKKFPTITVMRYSGAFDIGDKLAAKMAKEVDTFAYGVGD